MPLRISFDELQKRMAIKGLAEYLMLGSSTMSGADMVEITVRLTALARDMGLVADRRVA